MSIENFIFSIPLWVALVDSIICNILFFILGIFTWYPIRYMSMSERKLIFSLLNHFLLGLFLLGIWLTVGYQIMILLIGDNYEIQLFIHKSLYYRALVGGLVFILLIMLYYLIVYSENLKEKMNNETSLKSLVREAELSALKAQINPHFLFNSLNSISSLTVRDPAKARKMIIELSEYLRYSLKDNDKEFISLEEEIKNIQRYMEIERIRFGEKLLFESEVQQDCYSKKLPVMILQPLFENAIKHGVYESTTPVKVKMKCTCNELGLLIRITNNFDVDQVGRIGAGLGLKNIRNRLSIIYGDENLISFSKSEGVFYVIVRIPYIASLN